MLCRARDNLPHGAAALHRAPDKSPDGAVGLCSAADNEADGAAALYRAPDKAPEISPDGTAALCNAPDNATDGPTVFCRDAADGATVLHHARDIASDKKQHQVVLQIMLQMAQLCYAVPRYFSRWCSCVMTCSR